MLCISVTTDDDGFRLDSNVILQLRYVRWHFVDIFCRSNWFYINILSHLIDAVEVMWVFGNLDDDDPAQKKTKEFLSKQQTKMCQTNNDRRLLLVRRFVWDKNEFSY